jgi:hypothetical protein
MTEQPAASAAATLRAAWLMGKFQGVKAATGPTGSFVTICCTVSLRAGITRRDHAPVSAPRLLGEPVENVGAAHHLALGLDLRLAVFARHDGRDCLGAGAQEIAGLAENLAAVIGRNFAPGLEASIGRRERAIEIGALGPRHAADGLAGRRIEHR